MRRRAVSCCGPWRVTPCVARWSGISASGWRSRTVTGSRCSRPGPRRVLTRSSCLPRAQILESEPGAARLLTPATAGTPAPGTRRAQGAVRVSVRQEYDRRDWRRRQSSSAPRTCTTGCGSAGHRIGLTTVYRTLQLLAAGGRVDVLRARDEAQQATAPAAARGTHHHLHLPVVRPDGRGARGCGWSAGPPVPARRHGFTDVTLFAEVFGTCPAARNPPG